MFNVNLDSKSINDAFSGTILSKVDGKNIARVAMAMTLLILMIVSAIAPALQVMANQTAQNNNEKNSSNKNSALNDQGKGAIGQSNKHYKIITKSVTTVNQKSPSQTGTNQNSNNQGSNKNSATSGFKTISGIPSSNNVNVNETADLTQTNSGLSTANSYTSLANTTSFTYTAPSGYTNISNTFDVNSITATSGVYNIENAAGTTFQSTTAYSTQDKNYTLRTIASSFDITVPKVNITEFRAYFTFSNFGGLNLNVSIVNATIGGQPNTASILGSMNYVPSISGWNIFSFPSPVILSKGSYFLTINDTSSAICLVSQGCSSVSYVTYGFVLDSTNGNQSKVMKTCDLGCGGWSTLSIDIGLQYKYLILNDLDSSLAHVYSSPHQVNMQNNGRSVAGSTSNYFNYSNPTMQFTTNVSVTFSVIQHANVFLTTPSTTSLSYLVNNATSSYWNVSFTDNSFPSSSFSVSNRIFTLRNIDTSWNATNILNASTLFDNLPFNSQINYSNGSSSLSFNTSTDLNGYAWVLEFQALNYITGTTLNNGQPMPYPYIANSSDTLTITSNLLAGITNGQNGTVEIFNQTSNLIYSETNITSVSDVLSFSNIVLSSWINDNNPNGTYVVTIQWLDSSTHTKIGYYELDFTIKASTTLQVPFTIPDTIEGQPISLSIAYLNSLNTTKLNSAIVQVNNSWSATSIYLTNTNTHDNYTGSIDTTGAPIGPNSILITASLANYVTQSVNISFNILYDTSLSITPNTTSVQYYDVIYFDINYADLTPTNISGATVTVNGSSATEQTGAYYTFTYNTSLLPDPTIPSIAFTINASKTYYLSKSTTIFITLNQTDTNFVNYNGLTNNTVINKNYAFNSADLLSYTFSYNDTRHNTLLQNANLASNYSVSDFAVTGLGSQAAVNFTVTLDPKVVGTFPVSFTYTKTGYKTVTFVVTFNIQQTSTQLLIGGSTAWIDGNTYTPIFYYGTKDTMTMNLTLKDTIYSQIVTTAVLSGTTNTTNILIYESQNSTGSWNIAFNPLQQTSITLSFTLSANGYVSQTITIYLNMQPIPTTIQGSSYSTGWTNSTTLSTVYQSGQLDNYTFSFVYYDSYWNELINNSNLVSNNSAQFNNKLTISEIAYSNNATWFFEINPNSIGSYTLVFTFSNTSYVSLTIFLYLQVTNADLFVSNTTSQWTNGTTITTHYSDGAIDNQSLLLQIFNANYTTLVPVLNANNISLTYPSTSVTINALIEANGTLFYTLIPNQNGTFSITWTITLSNYTTFVLNMYFYVITTATAVYNQNGIAYTSHTNTTVFDSGSADSLTFIFHFNDTYYNKNLAGSLTNSSLMALTNTVNYNISVTNYGNGTWVVTINPTKVGIYSLTFVFSKQYYASTSFTLTFDVSVNAVSITNKNSATWTNTTTQVSFDENALDNVSNTFTIKDTLYGLYQLTGLSTTNSTNSYATISFTNDNNGTWELSINPLEYGTFTFTFVFAKYGYINQTITIAVTVVQTTTQAQNSGKTGYITQTDATDYNPGTKDTITVLFYYYDTNHSLYLTNYNVQVSNNATWYSFNLVNNGNGSWTITVNPLRAGNSTVSLTLYQYGYINQTIFIDLIISKTSTSVLGSSYGSGWTNSSTLTTAYQSGQLDNYTFSFVYYDSYYGELINNSNLVSNTSAQFNNKLIISEIANSNNATWFFEINPNSVGSYTLVFTFSNTSYVSATIILYLQVINADLYVSNATSQWTNGTTITTHYSDGAIDNQSILLQIFNANYTTLVPVLNANNITLTYPSTSVTITTLIEANGTLYYTLIPNQNGTFTITWTITLSNYTIFVLNLSFYVITTATAVYNQNGIAYTSHTNSTVFDSGSADSITFIFHFNDTYYNKNLAGILTLNPANNGTSNYITYVTNYGNGTWVVTINPSKIGIYTLTLTFTKQYYASTSFILTFDVRVNAVTITNKNSVTWTNTTTQVSFDENALDNVSNTFTIKDTQYNLYQLTGLSTTNSTNSNATISFTNDNNGTWELSINPLEYGTFTFTFTFNKYGYINQTITITVTIVQTTTQAQNSGKTGYITQTDATDYNPGTKDAITVLFYYYDTNHSLYLTNYNVQVSNNATWYNYSLVNNGNGSWTITVNPLRSGTSTVSLTLYQYGYINQTIFINLIIQKTTTAIQGSSYGSGWSNSTTLSTVYQTGQLDNYTFSFVYYDSYWNELINNSNLVSNTSAQFNNKLIISEIAYSNNATWFFEINPNSVGTYTLVFTFSNTSYVSLTIILYLQVTNADLFVSNPISQWANGTTITTHYSDGAIDNQSILLQIYNANYTTLVPVQAITNISLTYPSTSVTITTLIEANGTLYYTLIPNQNGTFTITWTITLSNYTIFVLNLSFYVITTATAVYNQNGIAYTSHTNSTVFDSGSADSITFIFHFNDTYYNKNLAGILTLNPANNGTSNYITYVTNYGNGTWVVTINPTKVGIYSLTFVFSKQYYASTSFTLTFDVSVNAVSITNKNSATWTNTTTQVSFDENALDNVSNTFTIKDTLYGLYQLTGLSTTNSTNSYATISFTNDNNGTWELSINPLEYGTFTFTFTFNQYGYINQTITITVTVVQTTTQVQNSAKTGYTTQTDTAYYDQYANDSISVLFYFYDTNHSLYLTNYNVQVSNNATWYSNSLVNNGNGSWTIMVNPLRDGTSTVTIIISQYGYINQTIFIDLNIAQTPTNLIKSNLYNVSSGLYSTLVNNENITQTYDSGSLDEVSFIIASNDTIYNGIVNSTYLILTNNSILSFTPIQLANHSWQITINPQNGGHESVTVILIHTGYANVSITLNLNILINGVAIIDKNGKSWTNRSVNIFFNSRTLDEYNNSFTIVDKYLNPVITGLNTNNTSNQNYTFSFVNLNNGTWSLSINPLTTGNFTFYFFFTGTGYSNITIILKLNVTKAPTTVLGGSYGSGWTNSSTLTTAYQSGQLDNYTFSFVYYDSYYGELINNSNLVSNTSIQFNNKLIISEMVYSANATWFFEINPNSIGSYTLVFTFSNASYVSTTIILYLQVVKADLYFSNATSQWTNGTTITTHYSDGTIDNQSILLQIFNANYTTLVPVLNTKNISLTYPSTSVTITTLIEANGTLYYTLIPNQNGTFTITWTITLSNYTTFVVNMYFYVITTATAVYNQNGTAYTTHTNTTVFDSGSADSFTFIFHFNDTYYNKNLAGSLANSNLLPLANTVNYNVSVTNFGNGTWVVTINPAKVGIFSLTLIFSKQYYASFTFTLTFDVSVNAITITNKNSATWMNTTTQVSFDENALDNVSNTFTIKDTQYSLYQTTGLSSTNSTNSYATISFINDNNGTWELSINPLEYGTFTFTLAFSKYGYINQTITITVKVVQTTTQAQNSAKSVYTTQTDTVYYDQYGNDSISILFYYFDTNHSLYLTNYNVQVSNAIWYSYNLVNNGNGSRTITVNPLTIGNSTVTITISQYGYSIQTIYIQLIVSLTPTNSISTSNPNTFSFSEGLYYPQYTNTSQLGYTLGVNLNWTTDIYNNSQLSDSKVTVLRNGLLFSSGVTILSGTGKWSSIVLFNILPKYNYATGWYNFTIKLSKYGYINQTVSFSIYIRGFNLYISLNYSSNLTPGQDYTINATLTYANGTVANTTNLLLFKMQNTNGLTQNIGIPASVNVTFLVSYSINDSNGNVKDELINQTVLTNSQGVASITIKGSVTINIIKINYISAEVARTDFSSTSVNKVIPNINIQLVSSKTSSIPTSQQGSPLNPLFIAILLIVVLLLSIFGIFFFTKRSKTQSKSQTSYRGNMIKLDLVRDLYSIIITTNSIQTVITSINDNYSKSKVVEEINKGLSDGIDTFLSSFQLDITNMLSAIDQTKTDSNNPQKVFMRAIERNEYHLLIIASPAYRGYIFLKNQPTTFAELTFFNIMAQIQSEVQIGDVFNEDEIRRDIEREIATLFPIKLLNRFVLNAERIADAEKKATISKPVAEALMRVFALSKGVAAINETAQKQVDEFNKILNNNLKIRKTVNRIKAMQSRVLLFNNIYTLMMEQLKIPEDIIVEALWEANFGNLGIFEKVK